MLKQFSYFHIEVVLDILLPHSESVVYCRSCDSPVVQKDSLKKNSQGHIFTYYYSLYDIIKPHLVEVKVLQQENMRKKLTNHQR